MRNKRGNDTGNVYIWLLLGLVILALLIWLGYWVYTHSSATVKNLTPTNLDSVKLGCSTACNLATAGKDAWCNLARGVEAKNEKDNKITFYASCETLATAKEGTVVYKKEDKSGGTLTLDKATTDKLVSLFGEGCPSISC
jgi:heme A synthase